MVGASAVAHDEVAGIVEKVVGAFHRIRDPITGAQVFSTIAKRPRIGALGLGHRSAGEVYLSASPGWGMTGRFDAAVPPVVPNTLSPDVRRRISRSPAEERFLGEGALNEVSLGIHGHLPGDPRSQAWFMAIGPRVPQRRIGIIRMADVAPTVLKLLGVAVPESMVGKPVF